ncbi:MAG: hypothetical protein IT423_01555, partial [Pirellulaceae bacterium]|nr:hypothetical protein [Pirellulaceae bacterium]
RFSAIIQAVKANRRPINYMPELITESLNGSAQRFEWTLRACDELTDNEIYAPIARIENTPNLINESNIQRVLQLGSKLKKRDLTLLFRLCLPHIKPEHASLVREMMVKMQATPELVDYVVTRDAGEIELWLRDDLRFSRAVFHKFEQSLRPADFREKAEQFATMSTMFNRMATQSPDFDVFRLIIPQFVEQNEWLWSHGYRPTVDTPVVSCLYLAIRFKDMELFKQTLNRNKGDLWHVLNEGMLMPASSGDKSAPSQYVPLLVVIADWDLEAVKLLIASGAHDWNTWKHESPLLVATRQKKLDIYRHLVASGIKWDQKDVGTAGKLDDVDQTVRKDIGDEEKLAKRDSAYKALIQAAAAGDMAALEKVLERFPFRQEFGALPERLEQQLVMYEAMTTNWRRAPGIDEVMTRAVRHPQIFNRLLAEGFPVSPETLHIIVTGGHIEVLENALCDMDIRKMVIVNLASLQNASQNQPELKKLLDELVPKLEPARRS